MEGRAIHSCKRRTASSWRLATSRRMSPRASAARAGAGGAGRGPPPVGADKISSVTDKAKAAIVRTQRSRKRRLARVLDLLENEIWPSIPKEFLGRRLTKREREEILG